MPEYTSSKDTPFSYNSSKEWIFRVAGKPVMVGCWFVLSQTSFAVASTSQASRVNLDGSPGPRPSRIIPLMDHSLKTHRRDHRECREKRIISTSPRLRGDERSGYSIIVWCK